MTKKKALAAYIDSALADMRGELEDIYDDLGIDAKDPLLGYEEVGGGETAKFSLPRVYTQTGDTADSFVLADGDPNFGEITTDMSLEMRRQAGKIRLNVGVQNKDGTGYGVAHIEARHGREIRAAGYDRIEDFVFDAVHHIDAIWKPKTTKQLVAIESDKKGKVLFIELQLAVDDDGDYYRVNSAFPTDDQYAIRKEKNEGWEELWHRDPVSVYSSGESGFAAESPNAGETGPTVSPQSNSNIPQSDEAGKESTARLSDDLEQQADYLTGKAKDAGYKSIDDWAANDIAGYIKAAEEWREENPAEVMYNKGGYGASGLGNITVTDAKVSDSVAKVLELERLEAVEVSGGNSDAIRSIARVVKSEICCKSAPSR